MAKSGFARLTHAEGHATSRLPVREDIVKTKETKKQSKADFVRSFDATTPASDIVVAGQEKGIKLTAAYIYVTRSKDKMGGKPKAANGSSKKRAPRSAMRPGPMPKSLAIAPVAIPVAAALPRGYDDDADFDAIVKRKGTIWAAERLHNQ